MFRSFSNKVNDDALSSDFSNDLPRGIIGNIETTQWTNRNYALGGYVSWPICDKVHFDARMLVGLLSSSSPETTISLVNYNSGSNISFVENSLSTTAISFVMGIGLKFDFGKKMAVLINLDYLTSEPNFEFESEDNNGNKITESLTQPIKTVNLNFGIGIRM